MLKDMTKGNSAKLIFIFTLPMLIGNVFQQLYNIVDSVIVGKFVGKNALAAVGTSFPIMFLLVALVMGLTMGAGIIISQYFGAGKTENVRRAVSTAMIFQFFSSIILSLLGIMLADWLLELLKTPQEIIADAASYLKIIFSGFIFLFAYNSLSGILRGLGDSKTPLYFLIIATVINIILDVVFVGYYMMGVAGAAWATVIAQAISTVLSLVYIYIRVPLLRFSMKDFVFDTEIFKMMLKYGIPSSVQQTVVSFGMMALQGLVNSYGSITMAAYTAASRIDSIAMMPIMNFGMAVSTFVGQNIGAGKVDRVKKGYRSTIIMVSGISLAITVVILLSGNWMIRGFVQATETEVIRMGAEYLSVVSIFYVMMGIMFITNGVLRGAGDMIIPMISTIFTLSVRVASAYYLSSIPVIGYRGIWWSIPIGWTVGTLIPLTRYFSGKWKDKSVVKKDVKDEKNTMDDGKNGGSDEKEDTKKAIKTINVLNNDGKKIINECSIKTE